MARLILMGTYSQKSIEGILKSGFDRHLKTRQACEVVGLKFISYDINRGHYDFVFIVEGEWEQTIGIVNRARASGDFDEAIILEAISPNTFNENLKKGEAIHTTLWR